MPILKQVDSFLLGHCFYATYLTASFSKNQLKQAKSFCKKNQKKLYVLVNKIFTDQELCRVQNYLSYLKDLQVDGIFFCDFAIYVMAQELQIESLLIFYHETFLRSASDLLTYHQLGIPKCVFSKDATLKDICSLPLKYQSCAGIKAFGYVPIYYSKRKILSHFFHFHSLQKNDFAQKNLYLKEKSREEWYPIIENDSGTFIFYPQPLSYLSSIAQLKKHLSFIIFDGIFENIDFLSHWIEIYKNVLEKEMPIPKEDLTIFSTGFLLKEMELE